MVEKTWVIRIDTDDCPLYGWTIGPNNIAIQVGMTPKKYITFLRKNGANCYFTYFDKRLGDDIYFAHFDKRFSDDIYFSDHEIAFKVLEKLETIMIMNKLIE